MSWVRWSGVAIYSVLLVLLLVVGYLVASPILKSTIENYGSEAVGAKVSLDKVRLSLSPLGFSLYNLQVTNAEKPMQNALQLRSASANVELFRLLMGEVVINTLSVDGVRFNTTRLESGALVETARVEDSSLGGKQETDWVDEAKDQLPSADEILSRETLLTDTRQGELRVAFEEEKAKLEDLKSQLPTAAKSDEYKRRVSDLTATKIESIEAFSRQRAALESLKADIRKDKASISKIKSSLSVSKVLLQKKMQALKDAPKDDLSRLKSKYSLSDSGASSVTQLLFGGEAGEWTKQGLYWYRKIEPMLAETEKEKSDQEKNKRASGQYIHFGSAQPPEFWIKNTTISFEIPAGTFSGVITDITHQPERIGKPIVLNVEGGGLTGVEGFALNAVFDHIDPKKTVDVVTYNVKGLALRDYPLSKGGKLPLIMRRANVNITGEIGLLGRDIKGESVALFDDTQFDKDDSSNINNRATKEVIAALAHVDEFAVKIGMTGTVRNIDFDVRSDLDKKIKKAFTSRMTEKQEELEIALKSKLQKRVSVALASYDLGEFSSTLGEAGGMEEKFNGLLNSKVSDYKDQQKQVLKNKINEQLSEKLKGFKF